MASALHDTVVLFHEGPSNKVVVDGLRLPLFGCALNDFMVLLEKVEISLLGCALVDFMVLLEKVEISLAACALHDTVILLHESSVCEVVSRDESGFNDCRYSDWLWSWNGCCKDRVEAGNEKRDKNNDGLHGGVVSLIGEE